MKNLLFIILPFLFLACVEQFEPDLSPGDQNIIVVEGFLKDGPTEISIREATAVTQEESPTISGASVVVESKSGNYTSPNFEFDGSIYRSDLQLNPSDEYRLLITLAGGEILQSDFIPFKEAPPIAEIDFSIVNQQVVYHLSAEDPTAQSQYYLLDYQETWQYFAAFEAYWRYRNGNFMFLPSENRTFQCFISAQNSNILLYSTVQLNQDKLNEATLLRINPLESDRLNVRYSLKASLKVLTEEGFEFWQRLRQNTESRGDIFDAQPSALPSNINCQNCEDFSVIGFISAGSISEKRIFNGRGDFGINFFFDPYANCEVQNIPSEPDPFYDPLNYFADTTYLIPIDTIPGTNNFWYAASPYCIDCRLRGGTTAKPDFW